MWKKEQNKTKNNGRLITPARALMVNEVNGRAHRKVAEYVVDAVSANC